MGLGIEKEIAPVVGEDLVGRTQEQTGAPGSRRELGVVEITKTHTGPGVSQEYLQLVVPVVDPLIQSNVCIEGCPENTTRAKPAPGEDVLEQ
jgi:hypothetical protein